MYKRLCFSVYLKKKLDINKMISNKSQYWMLFKKVHCDKICVPQQKICSTERDVFWSLWHFTQAFGRLHNTHTQEISHSIAHYISLTLSLREKPKPLDSPQPQKAHFISSNIKTHILPSLCPLPLPALNLSLSLRLSVSVSVSQPLYLSLGVSVSVSQCLYILSLSVSVSVS